MLATPTRTDSEPQVAVDDSKIMSVLGCLTFTFVFSLLIVIAIVVIAVRGNSLAAKCEYVD
eukprot:7387913-Prymnesium_polylepis.1